MKKAKINFLDWNNKVFSSSIKKIDLSILWLILLDISFYVLSGYIFVYWLQAIRAKIESFQLPADASAIS